MKRLILETGMGVDLYGEDQTKAARRAIEEALRRSSLVLFRATGIDHAEMVVKVTLAAPEPDALDLAALAACLPRGRPELRAVRGGLAVEDRQNGTVTILVTAAIEAFLPDQTGRWKLADSA